MKTREGFVSNSSTTSFICPVCNDVADDDNIHYCEECGSYTHSECFNENEDCQVCSGNAVLDSTLLLFALEELNLTRAELLNKYKEKYPR